MEYAILAANYDLEALDQIYSELLKTGTETEKQELAEAGYLELLHSLDFDFSCGKLDGVELDLLLPIVEKAENLLGKMLWYQRGRVYSILTQTQLAGNRDEALRYAEVAVSAYLEAIAERKNNTAKTEDEVIEEFSAHQFLAEIYGSLAEADAPNRVDWWRQAIHWMEQTIELDPLGAHWAEYLKLLYWPYVKEDVSLRELRQGERERFRRMTRELDGRLPGLAYRLASEYKRFWERVNWQQACPEVFPEADYLHWLELAKECRVIKHDWQWVEMGHLFHHEGERLERIDLLRVALQRYQQALVLKGDSGFPVMYAVNVMEVMARLERQAGAAAVADAYLNQAQQFYRSHLEQVMANFSVLVQYAEFLERCAFEHPGLHQRPELAEIEGLALAAEQEGNGFYSQPGLLLARCALRRGDGEGAVFQLTRLLLLHELCMEEKFRKAQQCPLFVASALVAAFLADNLRFMTSIDEGYYLDPAIKWEQLRALSPVEVNEAWQARRVELAERRKKN